MNGGFYKQYREILGLLRSGKINLLMLGIYTYLCLSANMVLGNGYDLPAGVVSSAPRPLQSRKRTDFPARVESHGEGWVDKVFRVAEERRAWQLRSSDLSRICP